MNPLAPSPRDWIEDASHENGSYLCCCVGCHEQFVGHKRRSICKVCSDADATEAKLRAQWLHDHEAPKHWVILTAAEINAIHRDYAAVSLRLTVEQNARRQLHAALVHAKAHSAPGTGFRFHEVNDALEASHQIDIDQERAVAARRGSP